MAFSVAHASLFSLPATAPRAMGGIAFGRAMVCSVGQSHQYRTHTDEAPVENVCSVHHRFDRCPAGDLICLWQGPFPGPLRPDHRCGLGSWSHSCTPGEGLRTRRYRGCGSLGGAAKRLCCGFDDTLRSQPHRSRLWIAPRPGSITLVPVQFAFETVTKTVTNVPKHACFLHCT